MTSWTKAFSQISQLKVKSVTDSLFKFGFIGLTLGVTASIFSDKNWVPILIFSFSGLFIFIGLFFYCYFAIKKPDYLRSEIYQLKKQAVEILGDNNNAGNQNIKNIPSLMNPFHSGLDDDDENPLMK